MTIIEQARELLALTEKATAGPWRACQHAGSFEGWVAHIEEARDGLGLAQICEGTLTPTRRIMPGEARANAELIAAANPEAIAALCRALIARDEALRELVACNELKERIVLTNIAAMTEEAYAEVEVMENDYDKRKPLAWEAARRALTDDGLPREG